MCVLPICFLCMFSNGSLALTFTIVSLQRSEDMACHLRREEWCADRERDRELDD